MTGRTLRLGTRGSELALWQARRVAHLLGERVGFECRIEVITTRGDRIQDVAFQKMEGKGFFTKELQEALLEGRVDLVVHSLKDLPTEEPEGLAVAAIPERADPGDLLLARPGLVGDRAAPLALPVGAVVGTSSLRRAAQVLARSPGVEVRALRGNVPTRVRKLRDGGFDAILLAAAGAERLELDLGGLEVHRLPTEAMLPAPGQGALAIEARRDGLAARELGELHDPRVARCVGAERALLALLGGGCHLPLGCLAVEGPQGLHMEAVLGEVDASVTRASLVRARGVALEPAAVAGICHRALRAAAPAVEAG
ncbi:MAG: hydroxymethylbilane synthase [Thermoanaerobaculales bacterium]|jgi:hydroxymethylbilane synthase|nr:hydroxymethylbilane synthase [Thermoanaerobaculales bacterium]